MHCFRPKELPWACLAGEVGSGVSGMLAPLPGVQAIVLAQQQPSAGALRLAAPGAVGELAVGGPLAVHKQLGDAMASTRFVPNSFSSEAGALLLLTGQSMRWTMGGSLQSVVRDRGGSTAAGAGSTAGSRGAAVVELDQDSQQVRGPA